MYMIYERSKSAGSVRKHDFYLQVIKNGTIANDKENTNIYTETYAFQSLQMSQNLT